MPDRPVPADLKQVEAANDVRRDIALRMIEGIAHARLAGEVNDHLGRRGLNDGADRPHVADVRDVWLETGNRTKQSVALLLQLRIVIGHHRIDAGDLMPLRQEAAAEMEADKTGAAGDQDSHQAFTIFACLMPLRSQTLRVSTTSGRRATRVA